jgi:hypothetical protein
VGRNEITGATSMNKERANKSIQKLAVKLIQPINEYMSLNDGDEEVAKMAVVLSAITRMMAGAVIALGMPEEVAQEALKLEMQLVLEAMAEDETKH